jgi:4-hydroxyphenylacetate 3-monooxygenase
MLKTGRQHLEQLRDGRAVYIGQERVGDVTIHPAFRNGARSIAAIYDMKAELPATDAGWFEEDGDHYSAYFHRSRTREDLQRRTNIHRRIANLSYGLLGRSPDHVASFVTGMAMRPEVFGQYSEKYNRLLPSHTKERHLRSLCGSATASGPQSRILPQNEYPYADVTRGSRA